MKHTRQRRERENVVINSVGVTEEAAFELGGIYSAFKDELVAFTAKESCPYSFAEAAARISRLLESEALREPSRGGQLVPAMWQNGKANRRGGWPGGAEGMVKNLPRHAPRTRTLSAAARERIAVAQRKRWAKSQRKRDYAREYYLRTKGGKGRGNLSAKSRASMAAGVRGYWAKMSQAERSAEMARRRKVADAIKRGEKQ